MFELITDSEGAFDSPDHLYPRGSLNHQGGPKYDWERGTNPFVAEVREYFKDIEYPKFLDLGCASGMLVKDALEHGFDAMGIDGSDVPLKRKRRVWRRHFNKRMFVSDITQPFEIRKDGEQVKFHIINAWEVIEHLHPDRLHIFAENVHKHLDDRGVFCFSISPWFEPAPGRPDIDMHLSSGIKTKKEWEEIFHKFRWVGKIGDKHNSEYYYLFENRYRGKARGREGKRHTFWSSLKKR